MTDTALSYQFVRRPQKFVDASIATSAALNVPLQRASQLRHFFPSDSQGTQDCSLGNIVFRAIRQAGELVAVSCCILGTHLSARFVASLIYVGGSAWTITNAA